MDFLTYFRKMKKLELTIKTIFTEKEQYLLRKQNCFVLDHRLESLTEEPPSQIDSDREEGPKKSQKWWTGIHSLNSMRLMDGLRGEIRSKRQISTT